MSVVSLQYGISMTIGVPIRLSLKNVNNLNPIHVYARLSNNLTQCERLLV